MTITENGVLYPREISEVPISNEVDYRLFSRVLDSKIMSASYKAFWLRAILKEVQADNYEIPFKKLVCQMVAFAWYPISAYKLYFGACDNLAKVVNYISQKENFNSNYSEKDLFNYLMNSSDKTIIKMLKDLTYNVPYRFLSPFFKNEVKGKKSNVEKIIEELSVTDKDCVYEIRTDESGEKYIKIKKQWINYLKYNYAILNDWTSYKLTCFLQVRNPNVPAIASKLEQPKTRKLTPQLNIWKNILKEQKVIDIYSNKEFNESNFDDLGVLSLDHFIPWSFVLHDQMWNLVPTFKNINSKKSDNLLDFDRYINGVCEMQYISFSYVFNHKISKQQEEYTDLFRIDSEEKLRKMINYEEFSKSMKEVIYPVYNIAKNQGFSVIERL